MKRAILSMLVLAGCASAPTPVPSPPTEQRPPVASATAAAPAITPTAAGTARPAVEGAWHGLLAGRLHLGLTITRGASGYTGVLDSIDQGSVLPIDHMTFEGGALKFEIAGVDGSFDGKIDASANTVTGTWTQHGHGQPLAFERGAATVTKHEAPPPLDVPIDVVAISTPSPMRADDRTHLVYELNVTNFSHRPVSLRKLDVEAQGAPLAHLEGAELAAACGQRNGTSVEIAPERHVVVYLWVTLAKDAVPPALDHRIAARVGDKDMPVANVRVPVRTGAPLVVSPPLRGKWWVAGNGPSNTSNHRRALIPIGGRAHIAQRFAIDWVKIDEDGKTSHGDPDKNESYYAYGAEALAVADGVVTAAKDGIAQNVPHDTPKDVTLENIAGNHVIVDLGGGRFAFWAHFQPGSLRVKIGDHVKRGQVLGLVGNSGNSTEPHLHFHVGDASSHIGSEGIPYAFDTFQLRAPDKSAAPRTKQLPTEKQVIAFP
jgi:murein DD-endopeptidase MepM/ murein hydrolase activator NlpD